jgi:hypothetical protein
MWAFSSDRSPTLGFATARQYDRTFSPFEPPPSFQANRWHHKGTWNPTVTLVLVTLGARQLNEPNARNSVIRKSRITQLRGNTAILLLAAKVDEENCVDLGLEAQRIECPDSRADSNWNPVPTSVEFQRTPREKPRNRDDLALSALGLQKSIKPYS